MSKNTIRKLIKPYLISTSISAILCLVIIMIVLLVRGNSWTEAWEFFPDIIRSLGKRFTFWLAMSVPFILIQLAKLNIRSYRQKGFRGLLKTSGFSIFLPIISISLLILLVKWYTYSEVTDYRINFASLSKASKSINYFEEDGKYRGTHLFSLNRMNDSTWQELITANIEQIVIVPYASQEDYNSPEIRSRIFRQEGLSGRDSTILRLKPKADSLGIQFVIKPHIWINNPSAGKWRGDLEMEDEASWQKWEANYTKYILHYAKFSALIDAPVFCIGNEYHQSTSKRPEFWRKLIQKVRAVYKGKLTYGANWDQEYADVQFWDQLDYIGIQAYYPLTSSSEPAVTEIVAGWKKHLKAIKKVADRYERPVIFTEIGYKSTTNAASKPWEWEDYTADSFRKISWKTQANCYQAFFEAVWPNKWFKGAWIWMWRANSNVNPANRTFSLQKKPAYEVLAKGFGEEK